MNWHGTMVGSIVFPRNYEKLCRIYPEIALEIQKDGSYELVYRFNLAGVKDDCITIVFALGSQIYDRIACVDAQRKDIEEAAAMVGVDFILNVVLNEKKQIIKAVAGDLKKGI